MPNRKLDSHDYMDSLLETLEILIDICEQYDNGKYKQAKMLAVNIRTLVHQTGSSTSLLTHLERQETMKFYNTVNRIKNAVYYLGMGMPAQMRSLNVVSINRVENTFVPIFKPAQLFSPKWLSFEEWWCQTIIVSSEASFTRKEIVLTMVNKDGGGHYDKKVEEKYYNLAKGITSMLYATNASIEDDPHVQGEPYLNLHYALVRQISHELILSILKEFNLSLKYSPFYSERIIQGSMNTQGLSIVEGDKVEYY